MKTEEYKSIEDLLDRFFEGQTSNEEERVLYSSSPVRIFPPIWNVIGRYSDISRVALPWILARLRN